MAMALCLALAPSSRSAPSFGDKGFRAGQEASYTFESESFICKERDLTKQTIGKTMIRSDKEYSDEHRFRRHSLTLAATSKHRRYPASAEDYVNIAS